MSKQQSDAIALAGRVLMSVIFLMSGFHKLMTPADTIRHIAADGLPLPPVAYLVAVACEFGGGLALLLGWQIRIAAAVLTLFCLFTAATVHYQPGNAAQMVNFWKNVTMAGGSSTCLRTSAAAGSVWMLFGVRTARRKWPDRYPGGTTATPVSSKPTPTSLPAAIGDATSGAITKISDCCPASATSYSMWLPR